MAVSITSPFYFTTGSIKFSSLRDTFRQTSGTIRASDLFRDDAITSTSPIIPDATENLAIPPLPVDVETDWSAEAFRGSVKYYEATQSGTDDNTANTALPGFRMGLYDAGTGTGIQWNGNLGRNIPKTIKITGTCGSRTTSQPAAQLAPGEAAYNVSIDVTGGIYGAGGVGGTLTEQGVPIRSTIAAQFYYIGNQLYLECTGSGTATLRVSLQVRDLGTTGYNSSSNGYPFSNITLNSQSGATSHNIQVQTVTGTRFFGGYTQASYDVNFDLPVIPGNYAISITSANSLRKSDNSTLNNGERVSTVRMIDNGPTTIGSGRFARTIAQGYALLYTNGITQNLYTPDSQTSGEIATGQPGGPALKIQTTNKVTINVGANANIYGGGGGGESGANGTAGTVSEGACTTSYTPEKCESTPSCESGYSSSGRWDSGCCGYITKWPRWCGKTKFSVKCSYVANATFPSGGSGGSGGNGQGYGQARTNGGGSTKGSCPTCAKTAADQTPTLGGYYTCGTDGTNGGNGGDWGESGGDTTSAGTGGSAGPAITGTFRTTGTITSNTVRGELFSS